MLVRFFGGWNFDAADAENRLPADVGYTKGVPMGGELGTGPEGAAPTFLVAALKDPIGANLDRIQIIKGWVDSKGKTHEKVYDLVWGDAAQRPAGEDGRPPAVGNTVDVANAGWTNTIGDSELITDLVYTLTIGRRRPGDFLPRASQRTSLQLLVLEAVFEHKLEAVWIGRNPQSVYTRA